MRRLILLVAALALPVAGCAPAAGPAPVVGLSYIPNVQFAPFYVAQARGFLGDASLRHHGANEGLFTAIAAGQEQFVVAGGDEALQAREQGVDLVAVASYYRQYPVRIIAREDAGIATLADLRGKRVGLPGRYGESWFGLLVALKSAGLSEADLTIEEIGYTHQAALAAGKVDAAVGFVNNDLVQDQSAGLPVVALSLTPDGEPPLVGASLFTTRAYLDGHRDVVSRVAKGFVDGMSAVVADPTDALTVSATQIPGLDQPDALAAARATLAATIPVMTGADGTVSGALDAAQWQAMADFLLDAGVLTKPADAASAVDTTILAGMR